MIITDSDYQILNLTDIFFLSYPNPPFTEILKKQKRAYNCLLFQSHYDYFICVPYRSEINHNYAFMFKNSVRSQNHKSGLDYTKIVIIKDKRYIDNKDAIIDKDEYMETVANIRKIKEGALQFVEDYIKHKKGYLKLHDLEYKRRYKYSSLQYFHKELGIYT
ncbi:MAG: hypothetical protein E7259_08175 [Lachnospiraceae bacterium]|nr:hypothetical protein [Lachnospiraceae bacterium]